MQGARTTSPPLALEHNFVGTIQFAQTARQFSQRDEARSSNATDLVFIWLANVHQHKGIFALNFRFKIERRNPRNSQFLFCLSVRLGQAAKLLVVNQFMNSGVLATDRAIRILAHLEFTKPHFQSIETDQPPDERLTNPKDQLRCLDRLHHTDHSGQYPKHPALGTTGNHSRWRRLWKHTPITGTAEVWGKNGALTIKPENRSVDVRLLRQNTNVVGKVPGRKIIGTIDNKVIIFDQLHRVVATENTVVQVDLHIRVNRLDSVLSRIELLSANVAGAVKNLALQIRKIDNVRIDQSHSSNSGCRQVKRDRGAESSGTDTQNGGGL